MSAWVVDEPLSPPYWLESSLLNMRSSIYPPTIRSKAKNPHTIGEELIMPCTKKIVSLIIGEGMVSKLGIIPLSNNTLHRRICDMSEDFTAQIIAANKVTCNIAG